MMNAVRNTHPLKIDGLAELAADLPDGDWYELRIWVRRAGGDAEVNVQETVHKVAPYVEGSTSQQGSEKP